MDLPLKLQYAACLTLKLWGASLSSLFDFMAATLPLSLIRLISRQLFSALINQQVVTSPAPNTKQKTLPTSEVITVELQVAKEMDVFLRIFGGNGNRAKNKVNIGRRLKRLLETRLQICLMQKQTKWWYVAKKQLTRWIYPSFYNTGVAEWNWSSIPFTLHHSKTTKTNYYKVWRMLRKSEWRAVDTAPSADLLVLKACWWGSRLAGMLSLMCAGEPVSQSTSSGYCRIKSNI